MIFVVNHLHFREPVTGTLAQLMKGAVAQIVEAGGKSARVVKVDDRHLILLLEFGSQEDAGRIARDLGGPWMQENIVPLLERDSERAVGEVLASATA